jgi:4-amino-4-deoxy-L-arabinose transferase-like glycosyltransferase
LLWTALVALVVLVAHLPSFLHRLMDGDEAIYASIATLMNTGGGLYAEGGVDNKPPGIFWVYSTTFRVFGAYQMTAVHAAALVAVAATCVLIYFIARELGSRKVGMLAALFYGILTAAGNPRLLAANTEIFMMLPLAGSVLLMLRRQWFWCGMLLVAAGAFRQSAAINVLLVAIAILWLEVPNLRWRAFGLFATGLIAGLAGLAVVLSVTGSLTGFWRWTVQVLYGYASTQLTTDVIWSRARDSVLAFIAAMAVMWIAALAFAARWRTSTINERLVVVWLIVAMVGSFAGGHLSWHYFIQAMGPLAVLAALGFDRIALKRRVAIAAAVGIVIPAVAWWVFDVSADPLTYDFNGSVPQHQKAAAYIHDNTSPSDRIFVWGVWPALYVESDRLMSSRFPGFLRGFPRGSNVAPNNWDTSPDVWPLLQADLSANPPMLIVDTAAAGWSDFSKYPMSNYPVLAELVANRYHVVDSIDGVVIYARNV